ncbi:MAG: hypothetical protein R3F11_30820, partial [Verrucomicrobiales bacterium]
ADGEFFRAVANQGPRKGEGGSTRQGRYAFTAAGKLLGFNNNRGPERLLRMLGEALDAWSNLPAAERSPEKVEDGREDPRYAKAPPAEGAVVKVYTRVMEEGAAGKSLQRCEAPAADESFRHRGFGAATDHLWLRAEDLAALRPPADAKAGQPIPVPAAIAARIARFHLTDNSRGEPPHWNRDEIRQLALQIVPQGGGKARLEGSAHLETKSGDRGFQGKILGSLAFDGGALAKLDFIALGDHWGDGPYTKGARPGRTPIGFAFQYLPEPKPADQIPPQAGRWLQGYYEADRH